MQAVAANLPKELPELLGAPDFHLRTLSRAEPRGIGEERHVSCDRPLSCCVRQSLVQHGLDVPHGLDSQAPRPFGATRCGRESNPSTPSAPG